MFATTQTALTTAHLASICEPPKTKRRSPRKGMSAPIVLISVSKASESPSNALQAAGFAIVPPFRPCTTSSAFITFSSGFISRPPKLAATLPSGVTTKVMRSAKP